MQKDDDVGGKYHPFCEAQLKGVKSEDGAVQLALRDGFFSWQDVILVFPTDFTVESYHQL